MAEQIISCKNCNKNLHPEDKFCNHCGAAIVSSRLTLKNILQNFADDVLGWDNKYLLTIRLLITQPKKVLTEYLGGVRKKYVPPFAFLAIATALAMLLFNQFEKEYIAVSNSFYEKEMNYFENMGDYKNKEEYQSQKIKQQEMNNNLQISLLKNLNLYTFLLIPLYALLAFIIFGKPYNFGEHLIITSYLQGMLFLSSILLFFISLFTNPLVYSCSGLIAIIYYLYAYGSLYKLSGWKITLKLFVFLGLIILLAILAFMIGVAVVIISKIK